MTTVQPILISKKAAAALLGISVGLLEKLTRQGLIERVRIGHRVLYRRDSVEALALTDEQRKAAARPTRMVQ
jgi:excisionase family DNA binding protein